MGPHVLWGINQESFWRSSGRIITQNAAIQYGLTKKNNDQCCIINMCGLSCLSSWWLSHRYQSRRYQVKNPRCGAAPAEGTVFLLIPNGVDYKPLKITSKVWSTRFHFFPSDVIYTVWYRKRRLKSLNLINPEAVNYYSGVVQFAVSVKSRTMFVAEV